MTSSGGCPLCGWPLEGFIFETPLILRRHFGSHCLNCGHATCNYSPETRGSAKKPLPSLAHLHLHVRRELRPLIQWTPKSSGSRPWKTKRVPWWPQSGIYDCENRTIVLRPEMHEGRLRWLRLDLGPGGEQFPLAGMPLPFVHYPRFRQALTASCALQDAILLVQDDPPKIRLLSAKQRYPP